jgi:putative Mg2+ transporter-C (MgtC) family protein
MLAALENISDGPEQIGIVAGRLLLAAVLGGLLGLERERLGKVAGLRTHILVALGSALVIITALESGMPAADVSRVIQGIVTGIGFIGGGVILKLHDREVILGVTTAANIWITCGIGMAVGLGHVWTAACATVLAIVVLLLFAPVEKLVHGSGPPDEKSGSQST